VLIGHGHVDTFDLHTRTKCISLMPSYIAYMQPSSVQSASAYSLICSTFYYERRS
jgi:hypothetical protein